MALQSLTGNGIRAGRYDQLRRLIIMTYGFNHTFTLNNLEKIGIFYYLGCVINDDAECCVQPPVGLLKRKDMVLVETASSLPWNVLRRNLKFVVFCSFFVGVI